MPHQDLNRRQATRKNNPDNKIDRKEGSQVIRIAFLNARVKTVAPYSLHLSPFIRLFLSRAAFSKRRLSCP